MQITPGNLIRQPLSEKDLATLLAECPPIPLLPPASDPLWKEVAQKPLVRSWLPSILSQAEKEAGELLPALTDELYTLHQRTGERLGFETVYFERRRRLARAALAALFYPDEKIWWDSTLAKWQEIFAEISWAMPAHVPDPSGRDPMNLDLFACETANLMGELLDLFSDRTPSGFAAAIRERLRKMHDCYLEAGNETWWLKTTNNWNAVCHQGILGSALAVEDDPARLARLIAKSAIHLENFLNGFTADGGCTEGPGYWSYGFGWFIVLNEQLEKRTCGRLSLIEGDALVDKIAHFGRRVTLEGGQLINFSDNSQRGMAHTFCMAYVGWRLDQSENVQQAGNQFHALSQKTPDVHGQRFDLFYLAHLFLAAPSDDRASLPAPESFFYPNLEVWIARGIDRRGIRWTCAAKGGNNDEHHNHNDCGSFLLQLNQTVFIAEIGAPEYTRDFFREKRYQFLATRSYGHSVPLLNGCEQGTGKEYVARIESAHFGEDEDRIQLELAASYPNEAECRSARRTLTLAKGAFALSLRDEFQINRAERLEVALMTYIEPQRDGDGFVLEAEGLRLHVRGESKTTRPRAQVPSKIPSHLQPDYLTPSLERHFFSNHQGVKTAVYRLVFEPMVTAQTCETEIRFSVV